MARMARGLQHLGTRKKSHELQGIGEGVPLTAPSAAKSSPSEESRKEEKAGSNDGSKSDEKSKESACHQPRSADGPDSAGSTAEGPVPGAELPSAHSFDLS